MLSKAKITRHMVKSYKYTTNINICSNVFDIARKGVIFKDEADIYGIINVWFAQFIEW